MTMTKPISDEDRKIIQVYVDEAFTRFKDIIKGGRPVFRDTPAKLDELATGEIFTAGQAKKFGLVDETGFIEDAIDRAIELAKLNKEQTRVVEFEPPPSLFDVPFLSAAGSQRSALALVLDLHTPQAYYLATTLPPLVTQQSGSRP